MPRPHAIPWELLERDEINARTAPWWRQRAVAERQGQIALAQLGADLAEVGAPAQLQAEVAVVVGEEAEHSQICGRVAAILGAPVEVWPTSIPVDHRLGARERSAATAVTTLCLSETVSTVMLSVWRDEATHPTLRAVETRICADESGHARLGFHWLRATWLSLPMSTKLFVENTLPRAFAQLDACRTGRWRELYRQIVVEKVIPELERHGVRAARAWKRRAA